MKETNLKFDINNLFVKKELVVSREEIVEIVYFSIQNGIVKIESENICGVNEEDTMELLDDGILKVDKQYEQHTILIKPFNYKEDEE